MIVIHKIEDSKYGGRDGDKESHHIRTSSLSLSNLQFIIQLLNNNKDYTLFVILTWNPSSRPNDYITLAYLSQLYDDGLQFYIYLYVLLIIYLCMISFLTESCPCIYE